MLHQTITAPAFDLNAAHLEAHRWVETARPLIDAYLALDQIDSNVRVASYGMADSYWSREIMDGSQIVNSSVRELLKQIEGIRDTWIGDLSPPAPNRGMWASATQAEVDAYDDLCEIWGERIRDVPSVDAAIQRIGADL